MAALPPTADQSPWEIALAQLRTREKAATRKLDALAAARRRLPGWRCPATPWRALTARSGCRTCSPASGTSSSTTAGSRRSDQPCRRSWASITMMLLGPRT